jgi:hypothetical protein
MDYEDLAPEESQTHRSAKTVLECDKCLAQQGKVYHFDAMELDEAIRKAAQILNEERTRPTVSYSAPSNDLGTAFLAITRAQDLGRERQHRPRFVHESSEEFRFGSVNYELLLALYSQVQANDRAAFVASLLSRIPNPASAHLVNINLTRFPSWNNFVSDLPLVAEFCIRIGFKQELVHAFAESQLTRGLILLLMQLEDAIALNFNLFSDAELELLATTLRHLRIATQPKTNKYIWQSGTTGQKRTINPQYNQKIAPIATAVVATCDGIVEECRQARYWYLKGALQQNANLEVNQDKTRVEAYLSNLGFTGPLLEALNAAEQDFRGSATPFELKNCLGHLRSFLEGLHEQACKPVAAKAGTIAPKRWGKSTEMLRNNAILSLNEESLAASLYTLISDEGVHPLIAEREYARLLRNMVIEYGLMFLAKLEKSGIRLT